LSSWEFLEKVLYGGIRPRTPIVHFTRFPRQEVWAPEEQTRIPWRDNVNTLTCQKPYSIQLPNGQPQRLLYSPPCSCLAAVPTAFKTLMFHLSLLLLKPQVILFFQIQHSKPTELSSAMDALYCLGGSAMGPQTWLRHESVCCYCMDPP
jgi:hypothetical protein